MNKTGSSLRFYFRKGGHCSFYRLRRPRSLCVHLIDDEKHGRCTYRILLPPPPGNGSATKIRFSKAKTHLNRNFTMGESLCGVLTLRRHYRELATSKLITEAQNAVTSALKTSEPNQWLHLYFSNGELKPFIV